MHAFLFFDTLHEHQGRYTQLCIETALSEDVAQENCDKTPYLGGKHTDPQTGVICWSQVESSRNDSLDRVNCLISYTKVG